MSSVSAPQYEQPAIVANRWIRNGKHPDAALQNDLAAQTNHLVAWHTKEVFRYSVPIASIPASTTVDRDRWRFAWHSGPYARRLWMRVVMAPGNSPDGSFADTQCKLTVDDGSTTLGTAVYHGGAAYSTPPADVPANFSSGFAPLQDGGVIVDIPADTDLYGLVTDVSSGRTVAVSIYEVSLDPDTAHGYVPDVSGLGPIYDADRSAVAAALRTMWRRGAAHLLNWTVDVQGSPRTIATTTDTNVIDTAITTVSAASPGVFLDFTNRTRVSDAASGVAVVMKVYGARGVGNGNVFLKDSGGSIVASVTVNSSAAWYSSSPFIPSASGKYDLMFDSASGTFSLYAVSLYQYVA